MTTSSRHRGLAAAAALLLVLAAASVASAAINAPNPNDYHPCWQASGGNGAYLPPPCEYVGDIKQALRDGTTTLAKLLAIPSHRAFICRNNPTLRDCRVTGGTLGGYEEHFASELVLELHGIEELDGFRRTVVIPGVQVEVHSGPQDASAAVQQIATEMVRVQGSLPAGDPDFAELTVVGGTHNGLPSPGHTVITREGDGYRIDSTFEVTYSIRFVGAPGSALEGHDGVIEGTATMTAVGPPKQGATTP